MYVCVHVSVWVFIMGGKGEVEVYLYVGKTIVGV